MRTVISGVADMVDVLVSEDEPRLCYHLAEKLNAHWDMIAVTEQEARAMGAVPCSQCFATQDAVQYPFPYITEDGTL